MASHTDARSNEHDPREHSGDGMPASADARVSSPVGRNAAKALVRGHAPGESCTVPARVPASSSRCRDRSHKCEPLTSPRVLARLTPPHHGSPSDPPRPHRPPAFAAHPTFSQSHHPPALRHARPPALRVPPIPPRLIAHAHPHPADLAPAGAAGYGSFGHVHGLGQSYPRRAPAPVSPHEVQAETRRPPPPPPRPTAPEDAPPQTGSESTSRAVPAAPRAGERTPLLAPPAPDTAAPDLERAASASSRSSSRARPPTPAHTPAPGTGRVCVDAAPGLAPLASIVFRAMRRLHWEPLATAPLAAVLLGVLLKRNLDVVSLHGMIMFPANAVFPAFGGVGVSMFFVTTIIAQLAYSCGASGFAGANGSMMIEVVPFFHILAADVARELGEERAAEVVATTLAAFALSAVLTGLAFLRARGPAPRRRRRLLPAPYPRRLHRRRWRVPHRNWVRFVSLSAFFVSLILGCGCCRLTVCARIDDDDFTYTLDTLKFFLDAGVLVRWLPALALAVLLRAITHRFHHQLIFPAYFLAIPVLFYAIVGAARLDVSALRRAGWLFDMGGTDEAWYTFYSYYSFKKTSFRALWVTMPTQFALLFFNILHPPLNVPALAVSLDEDVDTNKELVAHGYSVVNGGKADCRPL
ncbi:hypothetical protein DFH11DRAFT_1879795 [Phellopilus nigrolimitatus]|nr:hypothetical protein DFH11DRAFT_1879795 [Phellopilus nigrolimitatus]